MSALAARRAAQASSAVSSPKELAQTPSRQTRQSKGASKPASRAATPKAATPKVGTPKAATPKAATPKVATPKAPTPRSPSPVSSLAMPSDSESVDSEPSGPSQKRRKVTKVRYHTAAAEEAEASKPGKRRRQRAFSPSRVHGSEASSENGSSAEEDDEDDYPELPGTGAATPWSGAASPRDAGPSRAYGATLRAGSSRFEPREGVNVFNINEAVLASAGIKVPGPGVAVSLGRQDELHIAGAYTVTPLRQSLSLLSTTIQPSYEGEEIESYPVFAPTSHPIPVLTAVGDDDMMLESPVLGRLRLPKTFDTEPSRTIILIQENRCGIEGLRGEIAPGFNNIWVDDGSNAGRWELRGVHPVLDNFSLPVYPHVTEPSWQSALDSLAEASSFQEDDDASDDISLAAQDRTPVVLVKGPKRSGKSSLARAALNGLLATYERAAWLECDLGQGEFGCGGAVGLWVIDSPVLGPTFTHPRLPVRAHYLGELSPQSCPDEYMSAIHQLISHYQYEVQYPLTPAGGRRRGDVIPLVVNTQGWVKGLGEDLMRAIEVAAEPTHVFAFEAQDEFLPTAGGGWTNSPVHQTTDLPFAAPWEMGASGSGASPPIVCSLQPAPSSPLQARYTAADMRSLSTISYMYARLGAAVHWDFSVPLFAIPPWTVNLGPGGTLSRAYLIGESADAVLPADLPIALNGSLVALLEAPASDEDVYTPATMPPVDHSSFLGLALVRAVRSDPASDANLQLQIITPLPATVLSRATAVVRNGALELPTPAMLDFRDRPPGGGVAEDGLAGTRWDDVPFFDAADSRAVGGDRRRFRRNLQRKGN